MVGSQLENELILVHVLMALLEALNGALRTSPDKRTRMVNRVAAWIRTVAA